jgi:hypothetical protein
MSEMETRTAERIAAHGREALLDLLRPAFDRRAAARADAVNVDRAELERMVQAAAARADGVLWRRALAQVACVELRIGLAQAVEHPAVQRAQELVGAPPYVPEAPPDRADEPRPAPARAPEPRPENVQAPTASEPAARGETPQALRIAAVHLGGIETVRTGQRNIELRFSDAGLDVLNKASGATIGRLEWEEIEALDLPKSRRRMRPGRRAAQELVVRTDRGEARFELPGLNQEELRGHLAPMFARTKQGRSPD